MKKESNHMEEIEDDMEKLETVKKATNIRRACNDCIRCLLCANLCLSLVKRITSFC